MGGKPSASVPDQHTTPAPTPTPEGDVYVVGPSGATLNGEGWNPSWAPNPSQMDPYVATQYAPGTAPYATSTPGGSVMIPVGGSAAPGLNAYLYGSNPAEVSYDPATQAELREHRKALQIHGQNKVLAELEAFRNPPSSGSGGGGGGSVPPPSNSDDGPSAAEIAATNAINAENAAAEAAGGWTHDSGLGTPTSGTGGTGGGGVYVGGNRNMGGPIDDTMIPDVWGADPLELNNGGSVVVPEGYVFDEKSNAWMSPSQLASTQVEDNSWESVAKSAASGFAEGLGAGESPLQAAKGKLLEAGTNMLFSSIGIPGFNKGGMIPEGYNRGGWVGARAQHLNAGGMAMEQAGPQAYNEMMALAGGPGDPSMMMPTSTPAPEEYSSDSFGYIPAGVSTKEQAELDALFNKRKEYDKESNRKDRAFEQAEARKDDMHKMAMSQKQEGHQESMKQKRSGPQGG